MAAKLNRPLYTVACHDDLTVADLIGRHLIGNSLTYWQDGTLTRAVREGAICYLQEILIGKTQIDKALAQRLVNLTNALRALKDHDIEEAASTRLLVYAATLIKQGFDSVEACRAALVEPLSDEVETVDALMEVVFATFGR
jgi:hypothetical protein